MEKELFCPLPCSAAGRVAIGHPMCIVNVTHVTVIIRHNCCLYRIPVFVAIIAFSGWIVNICQEAYASCPSKLQFISHLWFLHEYFHGSVCVLGLWPKCPTTKFFSGPSLPTGQGSKKAVHIQFMPKSFYPLCQTCHCTMCCSQMFRPFCLYKGKHSCHMYIL